MSLCESNGFNLIPPGELTFLAVVHEGVHEHIYRPTKGDLRDVCIRYGLPVDHTLELVRSRNPESVSLYIDVKLYLKSLEKPKKTILERLDRIEERIGLYPEASMCGTLPTTSAKF
jgi:hypothetical protein